MSLLILAGLDTGSVSPEGSHTLAWDISSTRVEGLTLARYTLGAPVNLRARFGDPETLTAPYDEPAPVDPDTLIVRTLDPLGVIATIDPGLVIKELVGSYVATVTPTLPGTWRWRIDALGAWAGAAEGDFVVDSSSFPLLTP